MIPRRTLIYAGFLTAILSYTQAFAAETTVYPPTNQAAGGGVLYFPAGGNSSLYGIPSDDPNTVAAIQTQTAAINQNTASVTNAINAQTGAINGGVTQIVAALKGISIGTSTGGGGGTLVAYPSVIQCKASYTYLYTAASPKTGICNFSVPFQALNQGTYVYKPLGGGADSGTPVQCPNDAGMSIIDVGGDVVYNAYNGDVLNNNLVTWPQGTMNAGNAIYTCQSTL